jgi:hypothetical protein
MYFFYYFSAYSLCLPFSSTHSIKKGSSELLLPMQQRGGRKRWKNLPEHCLEQERQEILTGNVWTRRMWGGGVVGKVSKQIRWLVGVIKMRVPFYVFPDHGTMGLYLQLASNLPYAWVSVKGMFYVIPHPPCVCLSYTHTHTHTHTHTPTDVS